MHNDNIKESNRKEIIYNRLRTIGLVVMSIIIIICGILIGLTIYGDRVDAGLIMEFSFESESDEPIDDLIKKQGWTKDRDTFDIVRDISFWVFNNIKYPGDRQKGTNDNAYITLQTGVGNCLGQAHLVYKLCRKLGVKAYLVRFINGNIGHAVNIIPIEINGKEHYYLLDTTIGYYGIYSDYFQQYEKRDIPYSLPEYWEKELGIRK